MLAFSFECGVVKCKGALDDEEEFYHLVLRHHKAHSATFWYLVAPRVKVDYGFVDEAPLTRVEEVAEVLSEVFEDHSDDTCLVLGRELLIEIELFDDQVVVVFKGFLYGLTNAEVKIRWNVKFTDCRICLLQFLDPDV